MMRKVFCKDSNVNILVNVEHLNFTNNRITQLGQDVSALSNLRTLDLSDNLLSEMLDPREVSKLPASLIILEMRQNIFSCVPSLSWFHSWSRKVAVAGKTVSDIQTTLTQVPQLIDSLSEVYCRIRNSRQIAPLLQVVSLYRREHQSIS